MDDNLHTTHNDIVIIGAGMAGLACASQLIAAGRDVRVLDKGRGPGGRMAARRANVAGQPSAFDHGAQYFTARDPGFQAAVEGWHNAGAVAPWPVAGADAWVGTPGMNGPIKAMAQDAQVHWSTRAAALTRDAQGWRIEAEELNETGGKPRIFGARTILVAVPAEQAAQLLAEAASELGDLAAQVTSQPCWAVMAGFDAPLDGLPDCVRSDDGPISWAARNSAKPQRSGTENWVLHASPARSRELLDLPKDEVAAILLGDFFAQTGLRAAVPVHNVAHRWLYAMPASLKGEAARFDPAQAIGIAGDYLHSPRVEGAWISGASLAQKVLAHTD
ncbi:MAG: FAD-dependent oxidoreductase [Pseudomonadota bacterium]